MRQVCSCTLTDAFGCFPCVRIPIPPSLSNDPRNSSGHLHLPFDYMHFHCCSSLQKRAGLAFSYLLFAEVHDQNAKPIIAAVQVVH